MCGPLGSCVRGLLWPSCHGGWGGTWSSAERAFLCHLLLNHSPSLHLSEEGHEVNESSVLCSASPQCLLLASPPHPRQT